MFIKKYENYSLKDIRGYEKLKELVKKPLDKGVFLYGENGTGKTLFMNTFLREIFAEKRKKGITSFSTDLTNITELVSAYLKRDRTDEYQKLLNVTVLGIDDVADVYLQGNSAELVSAALNYTLRQRFYIEKTTWLTTDIRLSEFKKKFGNRLYDFLAQACYFVEVSGNSKRERQILKL
jgi:DNA replication protein DnaC